MTLFQAFTILNLEKNATRDDIKRQYRILASQWHPDKYIGTQEKYAQAVRKMQQINEAYTVSLHAVTDQPSSPEPEADPQSTPPNQPQAKKRFRRVSICISCLLIITCLVTLLYHFLSGSSLEEEQSVSDQQQTIRHPVDYTPTGLHVSDFNHLSAADRIEIQQHLRDLDYPVRGVDGIFGRETMGYLRAFCQDFGVTMVKNPTAEIVAKSLAQQARIATFYPEWTSLVRSEYVQQWYRDEQATSQGRLQTDKQILSMLDHYAFKAAGPKEQPLPPTGILWQQKNYAEHITIESTQHEKKQSYFLKTICPSGEAAIGFLRGGDRLVLPRPTSEQCKLVFVAGEKWYGIQFLFGPETEHGTIPLYPKDSITLGSTEQLSPYEKKPQGSVYTF